MFKRRFLAACLLLLLAGCGDNAKDLLNTAQLEEKQNNRPHATRLYRQIVEEYPDSPYAGRAKTRLVELEKPRWQADEKGSFASLRSIASLQRTE